jgi:hypothetical protein
MTSTTFIWTNATILAAAFAIVSLRLAALHRWPARAGITLARAIGRPPRPLRGGDDGWHRPGDHHRPTRTGRGPGGPAAGMGSLNRLLAWRLEEGSHAFPGPQGGTCINEAALVAGGFAYRAIESVEQMPDCFSRPICRFAMRLNDEAGDEERQRLLPFVARLACADRPEIERQRKRFIAARDRRGLSFQERIEVLKGALAIGRQADPLGVEEPLRSADARPLHPGELGSIGAA